MLLKYAYYLRLLHTSYRNVTECDWFDINRCWLYTIGIQPILPIDNASGLATLDW